MSIYIGNLPYSVEPKDLKTIFEAYGRITSVSLPIHHRLNRPRGFAFMEMESSAQEQTAIKALDGVELMGRALKVMQARSEKETAPQVSGRPWHRCIPFYRRPLFQIEDRFFAGS